MHISILIMTEFLEYPGYVKVLGYSLLLDTVAKMVKNQDQLQAHDQKQGYC